ncbi:MAG: hypothetical protein RL596_1308, partial [Bacteroidota bacterium]
MEERETAPEQEIIEKNADFDMNADENAAGTSHLNEPVAEESA